MGHPILFADWQALDKIHLGSLLLYFVVVPLTSLYFLVIMVRLLLNTFRSLRVVFASLAFSAFASAAWYAMYSLAKDFHEDISKTTKMMWLLTGIAQVFFCAAPLIRYFVIRAYADKKCESGAPTQTVSKSGLEPEELKVLTSFLTRRNELLDTARAQLAERLARTLYEKYGGHYGDAESYIERLAAGRHRENPGRAQTETRTV